MKLVRRRCNAPGDVESGSGSGVGVFDEGSVDGNVFGDGGGIACISNSLW